MTSPARIQFCVITLVVAALLGCGERDGGHDMEDPVECEQQRASLSFDEESELGFAAGELLDEISTSGLAELDWSSEEESTSLDWTFSEDRDAVYFVEEVAAEGEDSGAGCADSFIAVEGTLGLDTDDGKLEETIEIELKADTVSSAEISEDMPLSQLDGTLEVEEAGSDDLLRIDGEVTETGFGGLLAHDPYSEDEDSATDGAWELLAEWESADGDELEPCEFDETDLAVDEDSPLGFSGEDVFAAVVTSDTAVLEWEEGGEAELTWSFADDVAEVSYMDEIPTGADSDAGCDEQFVSIEGTMDFETDDGELDETVVVDLSARTADEAELAGRVGVSELKGELSVEQTSDDDAIRLEGTIDAEGSEGNLLLDGYDEATDDAVTDTALQPLGQWGQ